MFNYTQIKTLLFQWGLKKNLISEFYSFLISVVIDLNLCKHLHVFLTARGSFLSASCTCSTSTVQLIWMTKSDKVSDTEYI